MKAPTSTAQPSFPAEQADFFFPVRSCEPVGLRGEKSLFDLAFCRGRLGNELMEALA